MKKTLIFSILALALGAGSAFAHCGNCPGDKKAAAAKADSKVECPHAKKGAGEGKHDCGKHKGGEKAKGHDCGEHKAGKPMCGGMTCPEKIKGAASSTKNVENGVETAVTSEDPETVAKIQELALVHYSPKSQKCPGCPTAVPGAVTAVKNTENGILVSITGKDDATVKKIQAAASKEHKGHKRTPGKGCGGCDGHGKAEAGKKSEKAGKKYMCAMKCVESDKPGKCPKCGMPMNERK